MHRPLTALYAQHRLKDQITVHRNYSDLPEAECSRVHSVRCS
jgi:hypothetical protein